MKSGRTRPQRKDVREVLDLAQKAGFVVERYTGSGHYKMAHPSGVVLVVPSTPSGWRWRKNALACIKRANRREVAT